MHRGDPHWTPQRRRRPWWRMINIEHTCPTWTHPIRACKAPMPEHSARSFRPSGSSEASSRWPAFKVLTSAAAMSGKPETLRSRSDAIWEWSQPCNRTSLASGGEQRTKSAHGSALSVLMTAMPTIATSMASAREIRYKVPPGFIVKVGQRPRVVPGSLEGPLGDPSSPLPVRRNVPTSEGGT